MWPFYTKNLYSYKASEEFFLGVTLVFTGHRLPFYTAIHYRVHQLGKPKTTEQRSDYFHSYAYIYNVYYIHRLVSWIVNAYI